MIIFFAIGALVFWGATFSKKLDAPKGLMLMGALVLTALTVVSLMGM